MVTLLSETVRLDPSSPVVDMLAELHARMAERQKKLVAVGIGSYLRWQPNGGAAGLYDSVCELLVDEADRDRAEVALLKGENKG